MWDEWCDVKEDRTVYLCDWYCKTECEVNMKNAPCDLEYKTKDFKDTDICKGYEAD